MNTSLGAAMLGIALSASLPALAADEPWKEQLRTEILSRYSAQKGNTASLKTTSPGVELILQQEGVVAESMDVAGFSKYPVTPIRDGQVVTIGTGNSGGGFFSQENIGKRLRKGERVRLINVQINHKKNKLFGTVDTLAFSCKDMDCVVLYAECEPQTIEIHGTTQQATYRGAMRFEFPVGYLQTAPVAEVFTTLNKVVRSQQDLDQAPAPTVALGQTPEEVQQILGKPERIMDLGPKKILVYKDMKIIFIAGKVSDVQ